MNTQTLLLWGGWLLIVTYSIALSCSAAKQARLRQCGQRVCSMLTAFLLIGGVLVTITALEGGSSTNMLYAYSQVVGTGAFLIAFIGLLQGLHHPRIRPFMAWLGVAWLSSGLLISPVFGIIAYDARYKDSIGHGFVLLLIVPILFIAILTFIIALYPTVRHFLNEDRP